MTRPPLRRRDRHRFPTKLIGGLRLTRWLPHVDALVSMGGYNTLLESLSVGTPVVCVPRVAPRREQTIRAHMFARRGLLRCVAPDELAPRTLAAAVTAALGTSRPALRGAARQVLGLDGAERAAELLLATAAHASWQRRPSA